MHRDPKSTPPLRLIDGGRGQADELLEQAKHGGIRGATALYDHFAEPVNRLVWRLLGADPDHDDVVQQIFTAVLAGVSKVRDPHALAPWVLSVAVKTVRTEIRRRRFRRLLQLGATLPDVPVESADFEARALLRQAYAIIARMPVDDRIAFTLRHIDDQPTAEVALLSGCSLATAKRRLARAEQRFARLAGRVPELAERLGRGVEPEKDEPEKDDDGKGGAA